MSISRERATARILVSLGNQQTRSISPKLRNVDFRARKGKMLISRQLSRDGKDVAFTSKTAKTQFHARRKLKSVDFRST